MKTSRLTSELLSSHSDSHHSRAGKHHKSPIHESVSNAKWPSEWINRNELNSKSPYHCGRPANFGVEKLISFSSLPLSLLTLSLFCCPCCCLLCHFFCCIFVLVFVHYLYFHCLRFCCWLWNGNESHWKEWKFVETTRKSLKRMEPVVDKLKW